MRVTVIGTGYVGTVTGACLSYLGHHVTCVDTDAAKIARLQRGESPIYEPHLETMLSLAAERGGIEFSTELSGAVRASDVIFIAVGTPPLPTGEANLSLPGSRRAQHRRRHGRHRASAWWSTNPPCRWAPAIWWRRWCAKASPKRGRRPATHPLRRGQQSGVPARRLRAWPIRSIPTASWSGGDAATLAVMRELYEPLVAQVFDAAAGRAAARRRMISVPLLTTSLTSAEMIKYAANAFLAMKIGFANEIANICERVGAEATEVMAGIGLDSRIGAQVPQPRRRLGRQLLRQGHSGAAAHRARVRLLEQAAARPRSKSTPRSGRW